MRPRNGNSLSGSDFWPIAAFPNTYQKEEFLAQVKRWNRIEGLPTIDTVPMSDGFRVRFRSTQDGGRGVRRLIDCYGGWIPNERRKPPRLSAA